MHRSGRIADAQNISDSLNGTPREECRDKQKTAQSEGVVAQKTSGNKEKNAIKYQHANYEVVLVKVSRDQAAKSAND
jgi:hypothetical protein